MVAVAPEAVSVPEKVLAPLKVWVPARIASSLEVFGSVKVLVVPVLSPERLKRALLVGSPSLSRLKTASDTFSGAPNACQADPVQLAKMPSAAIQASQPGRGTRRVQAPSTQ
jgi:hypothetical protein